MDIHELKHDIIQYSKTIGIDKIGFTTASPFDELKIRYPAEELQLSIWF